jgi:transcription elongation factor GreA
LGAAVLGLSVGDTGTFTAPNGRDISVEVVAVDPYTG